MEVPKSTAQVESSKKSKDLFDGDQKTVSQYDDGNNVNGGMSPYKGLTKVDTSELPIPGTDKEETAKMSKKVAELSKADAKKKSGIPDAVGDSNLDIKIGQRSKADSDESFGDATGIPDKDYVQQKQTKKTEDKIEKKEEKKVEKKVETKTEE